MRAVILVAIAVILVLTLIVIPHPSDNALGISVSQLGNGIKLHNLGTTDCVVFLRYPSGADQRIVLAAGETSVILNIPQPVEVSAVCK